MGWHLFFRAILLLLVFGISVSASGQAHSADFAIPILLYHRFAPTSSNGFTVTVSEFREQMTYLKTHGYRVIPLRTLVDYYLGQGPPPPSRSVVITIDDGHVSVYRYAFPILKSLGFPATLFIYPCCIQNASYALNWAQLREMANQGMEIGSHTRYHPNFKTERRRLAPAAYEELVARELTSSRKILEERLQVPVRYLSYPFGYHDQILEGKAYQAGYQAMLTISRRPCTPNSSRGTLGRYIIPPHLALRSFAHLLSIASLPPSSGSSLPGAHSPSSFRHRRE